MPPPSVRSENKRFSMSRWSVRTFLTWLVLACLLPGVIGAIGLLIYEYRQERSQLEANTIQTARALGQTVDSYLFRATAIAQTLATDSSLARKDFALFHQRAREAVAQVGPGFGIVLTDKASQQILHTRQEYGTLLPHHGNPAQVRRVLDTGKPAISDLFIGNVLKRPVMSIDVPVFMDGKVAYALSIGILPDHFNTIFKTQNLPPDWVVQIFDTSGTLVARTHSPDRFVGTKGNPAIVQRLRESSEGIVEHITLDGIPVRSAYSRSTTTNWSVAIGIPQAQFVTPLRHSLTMLGMGVSSLFVIGLGLAWFLGGKIARSFHCLREPALALGSGKTLPVPPVEVKEAADLGRAMEEAAALLQERTAILRKREGELAVQSAALRQSEIRLQTLTQHAPAAIAIFDRDMRYLAASHRWMENYQLVGRDIIGLSHYEVFPDIPEVWKDAHRRGLAGEVLQAKEDQFKQANGLVQWHNWEIWPWRDENGEVGGIVITAEDITERKSAEERIRISEENYRTLFSNMAEAFGVGEPIFDAQGCPVDIRWVEVNDAFYLQTGVPKELIGHPVREFIPLLEKIWIERYAKVALTGHSDQFDGYNADTGRHYEVHAFCPSPGRFAAVFRDVTERKREEAALQESELKFRLIADAIPQMIWSTLPDGYHDYYNRQWYEFTGVPEGTTDGEEWNGMFHPEDQPRAWEIWRHSLATGEPYEIEYRLRHRSGEYRWVLGLALPVRDGDGTILRWMGTCTDIHEQKRASEALQESESRFRRMADSAPVMIWVAGPDHLCTWFNQSWLAFTGRSMDEELGDGWVEGIHPEDAERAIQTYIAAFGRQEELTLEYRLRRHDGQYRWVLDHGVPRWEHEGKFAGYIGTCMDITEERRAKEDLLNLNQALEERVQARTQELEQSHDALVSSNLELQRFTYIAAHDLQTPLRSIASFTQLLQMRLKDQLDAETTEFMRQVSANAKRMRTLIDDLLAYSRVDSQARPFEEADMAKLVEEVLSSLAGTIRESGAKVTSGDLPTLFVDRTQIAQVLTNLIENGIKYNKSEQIVVEVSAKQEGEEWIFAVRDNGIGIEPRHQAQIFTAFKRLHGYHEYPGSGVGLAICQRVIERHRGRIWIESMPGEGSTFYFTVRDHKRV